MFTVKQLRIDGNVYNRIENWLSNRRQIVFINGNVWDWSPVTVDVPQGSVLGPVLFIMYINYIDLGINNFISEFADDTKIRNYNHRPQHDESPGRQEKISERSERWKMPFNANKCHILQISTKNQKIAHEMNDVKLVQCVKDLFVTIASLQPQISQQCKDAAEAKR